MKKKILVPAVASLMLMSGVVGGSLAYLIDTTGPVKNTFTVGNVDITLEETDTTDDNGVATKNFKMVPGVELGKDPVVTVEGNSEACWLFVKVEKSDVLDQYISYQVDTQSGAWNELPDQSGVYYREVASSTQDQEFKVLTISDDNPNGKVTVKTTVTKEMMDALNEKNAIQPTLTFTAYAVQKKGFASAELAWGEYQDPTTEE